MKRSIAVGLVLILSLVGAPAHLALADDVEQRIATFWKRVDALGPADLLTATDVGQWALNVTERDAGAALTVADFRASTATMQVAFDRAGVGVPPGTPRTTDVEARIARFWARIEALGPTDLLSAADIGQWALNVTDRDPNKRIRVDDFRSSTAEMQAALDTARSQRRASASPTPAPRALYEWGRVVRADRTFGESATATLVPGPASSIAAISAGGGHALILRTDGTVWAWGSNLAGQIGDATSVNRLSPVQVRDLTDVTAISAGGSFSLALRRDGTVWAWGSNGSGQLGIGPVPATAPTQVPGLANVVLVHAGQSSSSFAATADGTVWAWGWNMRGMLGDGTTTDRLAPVRVVEVRDVIQISSGVWHTLALKRDGSVWAWGSNDYGQLGDGTKPCADRPAEERATCNGDRLTPVRVQGLSDVAGIHAGSLNSPENVAVKRDGTVWRWGSFALDGAIRYGVSPIQVKGLSGITAISGGENFRAALRADGTVWTWGEGRSGQLGDGRKRSSDAPVRVAGLPIVIGISANGDHGIAY